jgi:hypothetical protein
MIYQPEELAPRVSPRRHAEQVRGGGAGQRKSATIARGDKGVRPHNPGRSRAV